jgi:hypothetical protein
MWTFCGRFVDVHRPSFSHLFQQSHSVRLAILNSYPVITRACATISAALVLRKKRTRSPPAGGGKVLFEDCLVWAATSSLTACNRGLLKPVSCSSLLLRDEGGAPAKPLKVLHNIQLAQSLASLIAGR